MHAALHMLLCNQQGRPTVSPTCRPLLSLACSPSAPSAGGALRPRPRPLPGARGSRGGRAGGVMPFSSLYCSRRAKQQLVREGWCQKSPSTPCSAAAGQQQQRQRLQQQQQQQSPVSRITVPLRASTASAELATDTSPHGSPQFQHSRPLTCFTSRSSRSSRTRMLRPPRSVPFSLHRERGYSTAWQG